MSVLIRDKAECYENHPNDSRVNGPYQICPTLSKRMGTGGGILLWKGMRRKKWKQKANT